MLKMSNIPRRIEKRPHIPKSNVHQQVTLPKKIPTVYFVFNNIKMWIEMFFIKFEDKIENIRGIAENIFNFTQELNEKH